METDQIKTVVEEVLRQLVQRQPLPPAPAEPECLTITEVARRTSFSYDFVYDAVTAGDLPATKKGREWRVAVADMRSWMHRDKTGTARPSRSEKNDKLALLMPGLKS